MNLFLSLLLFLIFGKCKKGHILRQVVRRCLDPSMPYLPSLLQLRLRWEMKFMSKVRSKLQISLSFQWPEVDRNIVILPKILLRVGEKKWQCVFESSNQRNIINTLLYLYTMSICHGLWLFNKLLYTHTYYTYNIIWSSKLPCQMGSSAIASVYWWEN